MQLSNPKLEPHSPSEAEWAIYIWPTPRFESKLRNSAMYSSVVLSPTTNTEPQVTLIGAAQLPSQPALAWCRNRSSAAWRIVLSGWNHLLIPLLCRRGVAVPI